MVPGAEGHSNAEDEDGEIGRVIALAEIGLISLFSQRTPSMLPRPLIVATLIGASVGVPYVASHSAIGQKETPPANLASTSSNAVTGTNTPPAATYGAIAADSTFAYPAASLPVGAVAPAPAVASSPVDGARFSSVAQFLRFDVTKEWVCRNWPRKSTGPTDVGLFAIRVPLVMGTQMSALVGSLTYFFNEQGQVEHISFRGRTGDAMPLVQYLTHYYHFQRVQSAIGEHVYQVQEGDGIRSELRTKPEPVLKASAPQQSVMVELEFARPGTKRYLPPRGPALQVPPTAANPTPPNAPTNSADGSVNSAVSNYWNQIRYATPQEQSPLHWNRWPD